jgi:hypothetical protein
MLAVNVAYAFVLLALSACATTLYESQLLELDSTRTTQSPSIDSDHLAVRLSVTPTTTERRAKYVGFKGPYAVMIFILDQEDSGEMLTAIEVNEAAIEISYRAGLDRQTTLSTVATDWNRNKQTGALGREYRSFVLPASKTPRLNVDFALLEEIRFRLKFTGVHANGDRHDYWVEQHLRPQLLREELNMFELLMKQ